MNNLQPIETSTQLELVGNDEAATLVTLDRVTQKLAEATTDFERCEIRDYAKATQAAATVLKLAEIQTHASVLVIRAEIAIAKANPPLSASEWQRIGTEVRTGKLEGYVRVKDRPREDGLTHGNVKDMHQAYHHFSDAEINEAADLAIETNTPLSREYFKEKARELGRTNPWYNTRGNPSFNHTGNEERYTPQPIIERMHAVFGQPPDVDPASCELANQVIKANQFYTKADDGLSKKWQGKVWLAPPFTAGVINQFVEKLIDAYHKSHVMEAILLVESLSQPNWFVHAKSACDVEFMYTKSGGRLCYTTPDGERYPGKSRGYLFYFGDTPSQFAEVFSDLGRCYIQYKR